MDTACLRIKFTPLLKGTELLNSKCCLEIVPEVSYIQNFDKLTWNGETNYIEYTIPMKYKIILRKQQNGENIEDTTCKTYHSCVDLLLSSSKSNCASGDISRMISDTFIINKTPKNTVKQDNFMNNLIDDFNDTTRSGTATYETITTLDLKDLPIEETEDELMNTGTRKSTPQQYCIDTVGMISCDKFTNTDSISAVYTYDLDSDWPDQNKSGVESNARTLSVALMCSVNTQDTTKSSKSIVSKAITCNIYNSQADVLLFDDLNTRSNFCNELQLNRMIAKLDDVSRISNDSAFSSGSGRSSPEVRIAQYVKYMKTELLPLNMFLDKLITKCSVLGVTKNHRSANPYSQNWLVYKSVRNSKNNSIESCEKSISNRAVYSIVFNE